LAHGQAWTTISLLIAKSSSGFDAPRAGALGKVVFADADEGRAMFDTFAFLPNGPV
jgi:hypothetical protein